MHEQLSRRGFLSAAAVVGATSLAPVSRGMPLPPEDAADGGMGPNYPTTEPEMTQAMVGASHVNAARVEELLRVDRSLALAVWDWGFGDWESALGAASHMGNREIAGLLMGEGARPDLYTFAMMDNVDGVRAVCEAMPGVQENLGPHGISLLAHARHGKAARVEEFLTALGGADGAEPGETKDDESLEVFVGRYNAGGEWLIVSRHRRGWLGVQREGGAFRTLRRHDAMEFSPAGAPHVRVVFTGTNERATGLSVRQAGRAIRASRSEG